MDISCFMFSGRGKFSLGGFPTKSQKSKEDKEIRSLNEKNKEALASYQSKLYAEGKQALLIILQAMDGAGKDSTISHVMSGINPQGVDVYSFKQPSADELSRDYLWRASKVVPARGKIAIFNRSYYEDVLVVKVHELYRSLRIIDRCKSPDTISKRYKHIKNFEEYLWDNGVQIVKLFLNMSKEVQLGRFEKRLKRPDKNWKFSESDMVERQYWDAYQMAYEEAILKTSTKNAPWYIVPADQKWYTRAVVSQILLKTLSEMNPEYPPPTENQKLFIKKMESYDGLAEYEKKHYAKE